jgi:hypothetical protein
MFVMKFIITIISGIIAACFSVLLISTLRSFGDPGVIKKIGYYVIPLILSIFLAIKFFKRKEFLHQLLIGLLVYGIMMSIAELFIYHAGTTFYFPTGYPYSDYKLHALYPIFGSWILAASYLITILGMFLWTAVRRVNKQAGRKNEVV